MQYVFIMPTLFIDGKLEQNIVTAGFFSLSLFFLDWLCHK